MNNLAVAYASQGDVDGAQLYFERALALARAQNAKADVALALSNLVPFYRVRDTALPLLLLPVLAPVLLAATSAFNVALGYSAGGGWPWAGMLGIVGALYLALGTAVWGPLLEET